MQNWPSVRSNVVETLNNFRPHINRLRLIFQLSSPVLRFIDVWRHYQVYIFALLIFAASRLVIYLGVQFGTLLPTPTGDFWNAGPAWYHRLLRWDTGWFLSIINTGYRYNADNTVASSTAFFPLYPLVSYVVKLLFGIDEFLALFLVANIAALVVAVLLAKLFKDELGDETALLSLSFYWFFPSSLFLSAGYSESLCLVFVLLSFILLRREKFILAAAMAGLAGGARAVGIAMFPVVLLETWWRNQLPSRYLVPRIAACGVLAISCLLGFMLYLGIEFRHPLAFVTTQEAWQGKPLWDRLLSAAILVPFWHFSFKTAGWFLCALALTIWSFWRLRFAVALYALGTLLVPYLTLGITDSMNRFVIMCFPVFMCLGILCKKRWPAFALIGIFAALLLRNSALFSQWYWVG